MCAKLKNTFATIIETVIGQPFLFLMSDIFDGKESKMSYIMQDFLQMRVNDVVRGRVERMTREVESGTHGCRGARKR